MDGLNEAKRQEKKGECYSESSSSSFPLPISCKVVQPGGLKSCSNTDLVRSLRWILSISNPTGGIGRKGQIRS